MTDITLTDNTRAAVTVAVGDSIQCKSGSVFLGMENTPGQGLVLTQEQAPVTVQTAGTAYVEKMNRGNAVVAHEAL